MGKEFRKFTAFECVHCKGIAEVERTCRGRWHKRRTIWTLLHTWSPRADPSGGSVLDKLLCLSLGALASSMEKWEC